MEIYVSKYVIDGKPISINKVPHARGHRQGFQRKTIDPYKRSVIIQMKSQGLLEVKGRWIIAIATFEFPHNTRTDPDNFVKYLQDGAAEALGIDDSRFVSFMPFAKFKRDGVKDYRTRLQLASLPCRPPAPDIEKLINILDLSMV